MKNISYLSVNYLIICCVLSYVNGNIVSIFMQGISDPYSLTLFWGSYNENKYFELDLKLNFTFMKSNTHPTKSSKTAVMTGQGIEELFYTNKNTPYDIFKDTLFIWNQIPIQVPQFLMLYFDYKIIGIDSIGLAHHFNNKELSFVHHLVNNKIISKPIFGIGLTGYQSGTLDLGGFSSEITGTYPYFHSFKWNSFNKRYWGINLYSIVFDNNFVYDNDYKISFQVKEKYIYAPQNFMHYLKEVVFKDYFLNGTCNEIPATMKQGINCECKIYEMFPTIYFVFEDGIGINIEPTRLFTEYAERCWFIIKENANRNGIYNEENTWEFGNLFFNKNPGEFDYDNDLITLYSYEPFKIFDIKSKNNNSYIKNIYIIITIINIIMSVELCYFIKYNYI